VWITHSVTELYVKVHETTASQQMFTLQISHL